MNKTNCSGRPLRLAMLTLSLAVLMSCVLACSLLPPKPAPLVYLQGTSRTVQLRAGTPAPFDGWLVTDEAMSDLLAVGP